ncbi:drebrin-like protein isoform X2 [Belonocnema kinseyi]|nr:drebrin-like protein isoform X2 [Belonocnema kinseyi]
MVEELNSGLIMYAFCRVIDTKTSLPKCLLINWQGDGAPIVRKGTCANHIRDIEHLLKGAHITINARSEEEVEVDLIMEKLARATGSAYKFNEPRGENGGGHAAPVGTTYRRVIPAQEINASERDKFWQKEEIEEKQRLEQERARSEQSRQKLEQEIRMREEKESQIREQKITVKENLVDKHRLAEQRSEELNNIRNQKTTKNSQNSDSDDEPKSRSEELRRERSKEAQQLIAQRTINARAIFEQNTSAGQLKMIHVKQQVGHKGSSVEAARKAIEESQRREEPVKVQPDIVKAQLKNQEPPISNSSNLAQKNEEVVNKIQQTTNQMNEIKQEISGNQVNHQELSQLNQLNQINQVYQVNKVSKVNQENQVNQVQTEVTLTTVEEVENELYNQLEKEYLYLDPNNEGMKARALYDYQAADDTEITFDPGDIITHIDAIDEGWWQGLGPDGTYGLFPANHVEVIEYNSTR